VKLRKRTRLKAQITALTAGLFLLLMGLIRANPQLEAEATDEAAIKPDYESFFAPSVRGPAAQDAPQQQETHTRTRAS
jgi:hypothetical protein